MLVELDNLTLAQLAQTPAGMPPLGVVPNLVDPYSEGYILITVGAVLIGIMFLFIAMRLFVKLKVQHKVARDDWTTMTAVIGTCLYYATCIYGVTKAKYATHMWDISIAHTMSNEFLVCSFFLNWPSALVLAFAKTSFFLMYLDLFKSVKWLRVGCYLGLIINWSFYTAIIAASIYYNAPSPGQTWLDGSQNARYTGSFNMTIPIALGNLLLDFYILVLPVSIVWNLHLDLRRRLGVLAIFATGIIACLASSLSIVYKHKLNSHLGDFTYWTYPILLLAIVEMCISISCSCMPASAAFWRYFNGKRPETKDHIRSQKKDSNRILKSSYVNIQVDNESTHGLADDHEITEFDSPTSNTV